MGFGKSEETFLLIPERGFSYGSTEIGRKNISKPRQKQRSGLLGLFRYATKPDLVLLGIGILFSTIHGASFPVLALVFGQMTNTFLQQVTQGLVAKETTFDYTDANLNLTDDFVISQMSFHSTTTPPNMSSVVDSISQRPLSPKEFTSYMEMFSIYYLYIGLGVLVAAFIQILCWELACERQVYHLRRIFFQQMLRQDINWYDVNDKGDLSTKLSDDVERIREGIGSKFSMVTQYLATFISGITVGMLVNWKLTSLLLALAPLLIGASAYVARVTASSAEREQLKYSIAGGVANEVLSCIKTVAAFGGEIKEIARYGMALDEGRRLAMKKYYSLISGFMFTTFLMYAQYSIAFYYGVKLIDEGYCTPGSVFSVFFSVLAGAYTLGNALPYLNSIGTALGSATTVFEVIDRVPEIDPYSDRGLLPLKVKGHIQFENVSFNYPARPNIQVLKNLNLNIQPGQTIALVGTSGAGKSTVVGLLLRLYDTSSGLIKLDGIPIKDLNVNWLRGQIGVVSQEPVLFGTSIAENICYGREHITQNDIELAAVMANAHNFIESLPEGYNTLVGDRGAQLSGGQKQRIAIARALVRDPKILLLDEATSALDAYGEAIVQEALERAMLGRTTLIIAHRLSTVKNAHVIYTMANGAIVESGTHRELINREGLYRGLVLAQMNEAGEEAYPSSEEFAEYSDGSRYTPQYAAKKTSFSIKEVATVLEPQISLQDKKEDEKIELNIGIWKLLKFNSPEWFWIVLGLIGAMCMGVVMPIFAYLYGELFVTFTLSGEQLKQATVFWSWMFVALGVFAGVSIALQCWGMIISSEMLVMRIRLIAFSSIVRQSMGWFDMESNSCGRLITRLARDAPLIKGAGGFRAGQSINALVTLIAALGMAFFYGWKLALLLLVAVPLITAGAYEQTMMLRKHQQRDAKYMDNAGRIASECMQNVRTVQSLGNEHMFVRLYMKHLGLPLKEAKKQAFVYAAVFSLSQVVVYLMYAGSFRFGAYLIETGDMTATDVYKVFFALAFCAASVGSASAYTQDYNKAKLAAAQLFQLIDKKSDIDVVSCMGAKPVLKGKVTFDKVHFHYPSRNDVEVLRSLSFSVEPGKTLALVGASGCGKSTVVSLLERFYDPAEGKVMVDDMDIKALNLRYLRSHIGLVTQEPVLFDCSIRDNIAYGIEGIQESNPQILFENIMQAAMIANIHNFIISLPQGYDTMVGERGTQLSGGQKQRIAIARALIRNPKILLMDEATSALDTENEKIVQDALDRAREGRTSIVIAHRLSTIENADWIAVIHQGQVVEEGTHNSLKLKRGRYQKLIKKQQL